jgi:hypothetical protein
MSEDLRREKDIDNNIVTVLNYVKSDIDFFNKYDMITFNLMGGELFYLDDIYYDKYYDFVIKLNEEVKNISDSVEKHIRIFSNLCYNKDRLNAFTKFVDFVIENTNFHVSINTSFDFMHRFKTDEQFELFSNNCQFVNDYLLNKNITIPFTMESVLTKQALQFFSENYNNKHLKAIETFDRIYNNMKIDHQLSEFILNSINNIEFHK